MYMRRKEASGHRRRWISERICDKHSHTVRRGLCMGARLSLLRPALPALPVRGEEEGGGGLRRARAFGGEGWGTGFVTGQLPRLSARGPVSPPIDALPRGEFSGEFSRALPGPATGGPRTAWGDRLAQPRDGPWPALGTTPGPAAGGPCAAGGGWPALPNDGP